MPKHLLNGSLASQPKFAFLYVVISTVAIAGVMTYSAIAGLAWWQSLLLLIGCLIGAWMTLFSFLEMHRLAPTPKNPAGGAPQEEADPYAPRTVVVAPPTGDPYPHHEDYAESSGFDQGQLTSKLPDETPFIGMFLSRRRFKKQMAGRN
ncbi:MAG: hypothetical protein LAP38_13565 [Acidobacteriia bacterium]|nr:hypothetical protein [Terriglobia bacterium]